MPEQDRDRIGEIQDSLSELKVAQAETATEMRLRFDAIDTHFTLLNASIGHAHVGQGSQNE